MSKTAILVDGGFYRKRAHYLWGEHDPKESADALITYCMRHLKEHSQKHELNARYIAAHIQEGGGCGIEADPVQSDKSLPNLSGTGGQLQTDSFFSFSTAQSQQNHFYIPPI